MPEEVTRELKVQCPKCQWSDLWSAAVIVTSFREERWHVAIRCPKCGEAVVEDNTLKDVIERITATPEPEPEPNFPISGAIGNTIQVQVSRGKIAQAMRACIKEQLKGDRNGRRNQKKH